MNQEYYDKLFHAYEARVEHGIEYVVTEETTSSGFIFYLVMPLGTYLVNSRRYEGYVKVFSTTEGSITYGLEW